METLQTIAYIKEILKIILFRALNDTEKGKTNQMKTTKES